MATMYLVRVHFKNSVLLTYSYRDQGKAMECAELCASAQLGAKQPPKMPRTAANESAVPWVVPAICKVFDDAGRIAWLDGAEMTAVQFIDLEGEAALDTRAQVIAHRTQQDLMVRAGLAKPPEPEVPQGRAIYEDEGIAAVVPRSIGTFSG